MYGTVIGAINQGGIHWTLIVSCLFIAYNSNEIFHIVINMMKVTPAVHEAN